MIREKTLNLSRKKAAQRRVHAPMTWGSSCRKQVLSGGGSLLRVVFKGVWVCVCNQQRPLRGSVHARGQDTGQAK